MHNKWWFSYVLFIIFLVSLRNNDALFSCLFLLEKIKCKCQRCQLQCILITSENTSNGHTIVKELHANDRFSLRHLSVSYLFVTLKMVVVSTKPTWRWQQIKIVQVQINNSGQRKRTLLRTEASKMSIGQVPPCAVGITPLAWYVLSVYVFSVFPSCSIQHFIICYRNPYILNITMWCPGARIEVIIVNVLVGTITWSTYC